MSIPEIFKLDIQDQEKQVSDKVVLIDAQLRFVREVDGSIEHVTWFIDVDRLTDFIQKHYLEQTS